jgi:hypothetical protein
MTDPVNKKQFKVASAGELQADYEAALQKRRAEYGAAPSTVKAVMYELRTYGLAAIAGPKASISRFVRYTIAPSDRAP